MREKKNRNLYFFFLPGAAVRVPFVHRADSRRPSGSWATRVPAGMRCRLPGATSPTGGGEWIFNNSALCRYHCLSRVSRKDAKRTREHQDDLRTFLPSPTAPSPRIYCIILRTHGGVKLTVKEILYVNREREK